MQCLGGLIVLQQESTELSKRAALPLRTNSIAPLAGPCSSTLLVQPMCAHFAPSTEGLAVGIVRDVSATEVESDVALMALARSTRSIGSTCKAQSIATIVPVNSAIGVLTTIPELRTEGRRRLVLRFGLAAQIRLCQGPELGRSDGDIVVAGIARHGLVATIAVKRSIPITVIAATRALEASVCEEGRHIRPSTVRIRTRLWWRMLATSRGRGAFRVVDAALVIRRSTIIFNGKQLARITGLGCFGMASPSCSPPPTTSPTSSSASPMAIASATMPMASGSNPPKRRRPEWEALFTMEVDRLGPDQASIEDTQRARGRRDLREEEVNSAINA